MYKTGKKSAMVLSLSLMLLLTAGAAFATTIGPGTLPSWSGDATWTYIDASYSGNNYSATITNALPSDDVNIWFSFVYDRVPLYAGDRYITDINWGDGSNIYENYTTFEEWFTSAGYSTNDHLAAEYGRVTTYVDILGDLDWESIGIFTYGSQSITEVYVYVNQNPVSSVPEPATMLLLGLGLAGIAGIRRKFNG